MEVTNKSARPKVDTNEKIEPARMDQSARLLMEINQHWNGEGHAERLKHAVQESRELWSQIQTILSSEHAGVPAEIRNNLLIVSVYAEGRLDEIERGPTQEKIASLIALTRSLALSLKVLQSIT